MALREFTDGAGRAWRVWDIRPEQMHAATRAEDHLQNVMDGWLAFEPAAGGEKRRLVPIPTSWESASEEELATMLERAEPARSDWAATARRETPPPSETDVQPGSPATTGRTFRYPNGRFWTVNELTNASTTAGTRAMLRFSSGGRWLDTADGPPEWARMSEQDLADLLYQSFPRDGLVANPTDFRRRRSDTA